MTTEGPKPYPSGRGMVKPATTRLSSKGQVVILIQQLLASPALRDTRSKPDTIGISRRRWIQVEAAPRITGLAG